MPSALLFHMCFRLVTALFVDEQPRSTEPERTNEWSAQATVRTQVIAPRSDFVAAYFSPDSQHFAIVIRKGSRLAVNVDGVEGPVFDDIPGTTTNLRRPEIVFSPDGTQSAYLALRDNTFIVVQNQREMYRYPVMPRQTASGQISDLGFTNDGATLLFAEEIPLPQPTGLGWRLVANGVPGPPSHRYGPPSPAYVLAPAGSGFAAEVVSRVQGRPEIAVSVNGSPRLFPGQNPKFTASGSFIFTERILSGGTELLLNGTVAARSGGISYSLAPAGDGALVETDIAGTNGTSVSYNGKVLAQCNGQAANYLGRVAFSPNGEHVAYVCRNQAANNEHVITEGTRFPTYDFINALHVLNDGRPVYAGRKGALSYLVFGNVEGPAFSDGTPVVHAGKRVTLRGWTANREPFAAIDSVRYIFSRLPSEPQASVNGNRIAWFEHDGTLWIDGTRVATDPFTPTTGPQGSPMPLAFSADGTQYAVMGARKSDKRSVIVINGRMRALEGANSYAGGLRISPDGRHVYWREMISGQTAGTPSLVLDGTHVTTLQAEWSSSRLWNAGQSVDSLGVYRAFSVENGNMVHLTIVPDPNRSLSDLAR